MSINLTLPINSLGMGVAGLNIVLGMNAIGQKTSLWSIGQAQCPPSAAPVVSQAFDNSRVYDPLSPSLRFWHPWDMAQHVGKGPRLGMTVFELDGLLPHEVHQLDSQDIIFALTPWAKQVMVNSGLPERKIFLSPHGVDRKIFRYSPPSSEGSTVFANVGKWEIRKGHPDLARAFADAFTPEDDVRLVLCCQNPFLSEAENDEWVRLFRNSKMGEKVEMVGRLPSQMHLAELMSKADCGVFPSRAEGWNLDLSEMMAMGKPVIATNYSGHTAYCTEKNSLLIEVDDLEEAYDGRWFRGDGRRWAAWGESQHDQLVEHLRAIHKAKKDGVLSPNLAGVETFSEKFSWEKTCLDILMTVS